MSKLRIFEKMEFGKLTVIEKDGEFFFIGKEVAEKLGYSNTRDALVRHVDTDDKADVVFHDGRQRRNIVSINESGLYSLILSSKLPQAKELIYRDKKTGSFLTPRTTRDILKLRNGVETIMMR